MGKFDFKPLSCEQTAMVIRNITGFGIQGQDIMWGEYSESTKILRYQDARDETLWQIDCRNGMSCHCANGKGCFWTEWEYRHA